LNDRITGYDTLPALNSNETTKADTNDDHISDLKHVVKKDKCHG